MSQDPTLLLRKRTPKPESGFEKLLCSNCGRWLARVEDGKLIIRCKSCGEDVEFELATFAREFRDWISTLHTEFDT